MWDRGTVIAAFVGGALGLLVSGYALVYAPMKHNLETRGCVGLECPTPRSTPWRTVG